MCNDIKRIWRQQEAAPASRPYDPASFAKLIKSRVRKETDKAMQYFWASFTLQLIVFALLCHVVLRYWNDWTIAFIGIVGILLHLPFTYMLMKKFKAMAVTRPLDSSSPSLYRYVKARYELLGSFYRFKRSYERYLIPLSTLVGCYLVFEIYMPGELHIYWNGFWIIIVLTIISCAVVLRTENRKNFEEPLSQYRAILDEFEVEENPTE